MINLTFKKLVENLNNKVKEKGSIHHFPNHFKSTPTIIPSFIKYQL